MTTTGRSSDERLRSESSGTAPGPASWQPSLTARQIGGSSDIAANGTDGHLATMATRHNGPPTAGYDSDVARSVTDVRRFDSAGPWAWPAATEGSCHTLVWGSGGTVSVRTASHGLLVPPTLGFWIPGDVDASVAGTATRVYRVSFDPASCPRSWRSVVTLSVSPFLRETIIRLADSDLVGAERARTVLVLYDALHPAPVVGLDLPMPTDDRARRVADAIVADPSDDRPLAGWGAEVGAGTRTLARLFMSETGMTFAHWRLNARMRVALSGLALGCPVGDIARFLGYRSSSAFAHAFKRVVGDSPSSVAAETRGSYAPHLR